MALIGLAGVGLQAQVSAISPRQLVEVVDVGEPVVSPDGRYAAFRTERASIERNTYDTVWYVQPTDGSAPARPIAEGGLPLRESAGVSMPERAVWSPDGRWIYYRAAIAGRIGVWRAAVDGATAEPVTRDAADVRRFLLDDAGESLRYSVGADRELVLDAEDAEYDAGIRIDATVPVGQGLYRSGFLEGRLATQRVYDNEVERLPLLGKTPDRWKLLDLGQGEVRETEAPPTPTLSADTASGAGVVRKRTRHPISGDVALLTGVGVSEALAEAPEVELSIERAGEGTRVVCRHALCSRQGMTDVQWRPGTDEVLFTVTDRARGLSQSIFRWRPAVGEVLPVVQSRGLINGGRDRYSPCAASSVALVCVTADAGQPPRLERVDIETGTRQVLFDPNPSLAHDYARAVDVRLLTWTDSAGRTFSGQYYAARRDGAGRPPLFVSYYWCPGFVRGGYGDEWPLASLASQGISALCINYYPLQVDAVERYETGRSAVESAVEMLASSGEIDGSRIGMGGLSFGTEVTLWTAMNSELLTAASVSSLGISPLFHLLLSNKEATFLPRLRAYWQLGAPADTAERWAEISPAFNVDRIRSPVLMQLPEQEYLHTLDYALPLMRAGRADVYVFPHEAHQKFQPRHKLAVYRRNLDWFKFWLLGEEDASPSKVAQYEAWRLMRDAKQTP